jgi:hypothetical protein
MKVHTQLEFCSKNDCLIHAQRFKDKRHTASKVKNYGDFSLYKIWTQRQIVTMMVLICLGGMFERSNDSQEQHNEINSYHPLY